MYERLDECPSCKHTKLSNYLICKDHSVSGESFALVKCEKCQLIFTNPRPEAGSIAMYYESTNYISHTDHANNLVNLAYKLVRSITLRQKLKLIQSFTQAKKLLDFGCGTGAFLKYCQAHHYQISGFEPNPNAKLLAANSLKIELLHTLSQIKKTRKYDIITAWHVIEHVHDLRDTLKTLRKSLHEDGHLFIALPNINSYDALHYGAHWAAYDVPRHLYHFSRLSFERLIRSVKLKIKAIHPMKFDAYYVSLLSEENKTGNKNILQALSTGYRSNNTGLKTNEYSSLIYVLEK